MVIAGQQGAQFRRQIALADDRSLDANLVDADQAKVMTVGKRAQATSDRVGALLFVRRIEPIS
jgi:hypothetical protein